MSQTKVVTGITPGARLPSLKLDLSLYTPSREEVEFFKSQTKIENEEELKEHISAIQKEAWNVVQYKCIHDFSFTKLEITYPPAYRDLLKLGKERPGAIFLDFACCFGNDIRKAIVDGYPMENMIASDLQQAFWDLGHKLFRSTPETFPVPFVQGDVFDPQHIAPALPLYSPPSTPRPELSTLTSLTPLQGHVSAIHVSRFFHLFPKDDQIKAARALASLLSPVPGSMIFGNHSTLPESGPFLHSGGATIYNFNPEDWSALWDGEIFEKGSVAVEAKFREKGGSRIRMTWCVRRV